MQPKVEDEGESNKKIHNKGGLRSDKYKKGTLVGMLLNDLAHCGPHPVGAVRASSDEIIRFTIPNNCLGGVFMALQAT